jgi:hypothetical protein
MAVSGVNADGSGFFPAMTHLVFKLDVRHLGNLRSTEEYRIGMARAMSQQSNNLTTLDSLLHRSRDRTVISLLSEIAVPTK